MPDGIRFEYVGLCDLLEYICRVSDLQLDCLSDLQYDSEVPTSDRQLCLPYRVLHECGDLRGLSGWCLSCNSTMCTTCDTVNHFTLTGPMCVCEKGSILSGTICKICSSLMTGCA